MAAKIRLVGMFCGLGEERTRFRKKKKKKTYRVQKWVG